MVKLYSSCINYDETEILSNLKLLETTSKRVSSTIKIDELDVLTLMDVVRVYRAINLFVIESSAKLRDITQELFSKHELNMSIIVIAAHYIQFYGIKLSSAILI
jgi:hypothetical protein